MVKENKPKKLPHNPFKPINIIGEDFKIDSLTESNVLKYDLPNPGAIPLEAFGLCNNQKGVILLNPSLTPSRLRTTLLHEVLHLILSQLDLDVKNEEHVVTVVSQALSDVIRNNPQFANILLKGKP